MPDKTKSKRKKGSPAKKAIIGALIVGGIGGYIGYLTSPIDGIITLTVLGTLLGAVMGILIGLSAGENTAENISDDTSKPPLKKALESISDSARLQLREEQLEISKELVQLADVTVHKEIITEQKTITVPIIREELVVEKRNCDSGECFEIMRVPITEEQVEIVKSPVKLGDVSVHRNAYQETEHIEETVKKEIPQIETSGNVTVVDKDVEKNQ